MNLSQLIKYENNSEVLKEIKENKKNIVPFIGAGVSCGCGLYSWNDLLIKIAKDFFTRKEIEELKKLGSVEFADKIIEKSGNISIIMRKISMLFNSSKINYTEIPYILLEEFSPLLVTTNYDTILEEISKKCCRGEIKTLLPCLQGQVNDAIQLNEYKLLKIHGSVEEISSFVFSSEQYDISYRENGLVSSYLKSIFNGKRVLFVGCSIEEDKTVDVLRNCVEKNYKLIHYAIVPRIKNKRKFLERNAQLSSLGIQPIYYPEKDYDCVSKILNYLSDNNKFIYAMRIYIKETTRCFYKDKGDSEISTKIDILLSLMNKAYYNTANIFTSLLDLDYHLISISEAMRTSSILFIESHIEFNLMDICLYGFESYLSLGKISKNEEIKNYFKERFLSELLEETEVVGFLQKDIFSPDKIVKKYDGKMLLQLSDKDINMFAEREIEILQYSGSMSFDILPDYDLAERIIDYCSGKLSFKNRIQLLRALGAFCLYYNRLDSGKKHLLECVDIISMIGEKSNNDKVFLSEVYNDLAIIESATNSNLVTALDYNKRDIELKCEAKAEELSLGKSINLRATLLKEIDPFQAISLYFESSDLKEKCYRETNDKNVLVSWMLTVFNIGLVAKDLGLYNEALRIVSKSNKTRLKLLDKSSKNYCSSLNVECELNLLVGRDITNTEVIDAIQSRVDLPKGYIETQEHTWYVCALYYFKQKRFTEAINYINKAFAVINGGNTIKDIRQEVRLLILLANAKYELLKNEDISYVEELYLDASMKIRDYYGENSIYLIDIYKNLAEKIDLKYLDKYQKLQELYGERINLASKLLNNFDFEI